MSNWQSAPAARTVTVETGGRALGDAEDKAYITAVAAGSFVLAGQLRIVAAGKSRIGPRAKAARTRASKMGRVIETKLEAWRTLGETQTPTADFLAKLTAEWSHDQRVELLIDLAFGDPFAPYSLRFDRKDLLEGLSSLAVAIGEDAEVVSNIAQTLRSATRSHRSSNLRRISTAGVAAAVAIGSAGWLAAPALGAALGSAAGLSGAAATAHGLALLGGGSVAAGGLGMAGGMWLVTGTGAAAGLVGGSGSVLLYQLGAAEAKAELVKLQTTFGVLVLGAQHDLAKAQKVIAGLAQREQELAHSLAIERDLNDENAQRVRDLAEKLDGVIAAREWMKQEVLDVG